MSHTLIICEKPSATKAIAEALSDTKPVKKQKENSKAYWYEFTRDDEKFVTVPAVGHLFTLKQTSKGWDYPVFDVEWIPSFEANRMASFSEPYFRNIENLVSESKDIIVATDYDDEGEVIGYNILKFICGRKDAPRMKFSTMTKEELIESYGKMKKKLDKNLIDSGLARHYMDYYWGISMTRALTNSIKSAAKRFRILSTGRVQGPVLHMIVNHEKKIKSFKPKPFWVINADTKIGKHKFEMEFHKDKIWDKKETDKVMKISKTKFGEIKKIKKKTSTQKPPIPYNTTGLLSDIYRYFGYTPQQGLSIAEALYQSGIISYPRTNSQQLPPDINYKRIITLLSKQKSYEKGSLLLESKNLVPTAGKAKSQAHPAIYPTGKISARLGSKQKNVYDLIVRRFLSCFGEPSKRESNTVEVDIKDNKFLLKGSKIVEKGWTIFYGKYASSDQVILPKLIEGQKIVIEKIYSESKKTPPPARFSQGSVLKEMESKGLGTQATRAQIIQILYNRGYIIGKSIEATELGIHLSNILEKNVPDVVSEELTKDFENMTDSIETGKIDIEDALDKVKKQLIKTSKIFKKKEKKIGEELTDAVIATQDKQNIVGPCHKCGTGTLRVNKMWRTGTRFIGCTNFKKGKCDFGAPAPREGIITSIDKNCPECKSAIVQVYMQGKRPFRMCIEINCATKKDWIDKKKLKKAIEKKKLAEKS